MWKVVLVEDEPRALEMIQHLIVWEQYGFTIVGTFEDGAEAFNELDVLEPDLIISDIMMPMMTGLDLLIQVREKGMDCKFVMLTCMTDFEFAQQALEFGASGYLLKLSLVPTVLTKMLEKVSKELSAQYKVKRLEHLTDGDKQTFATEGHSNLTDHHEVNWMIQHIFEHYSEDITLNALAKMVNMDASYVSDLFKKKTGHTMTHFLQKIRVEASIRYLIDTQLTIQQIAEKCGFANDNYYIKVFKHWTGKTPGKFRY